MALHEMAAHACTSTDRTLEINTAAFFQASQVRQSQRLWRYSDFEFIFAEFGYGQARAIDTDAVAQVSIVEDL